MGGSGADGGMELFLRDTDGNRRDTTKFNPTGWNNSQWHHVVWKIHETGKFELWFDGVNQSLSYDTDQQADNFGAFGAGDNTYIGAYNDADGAGAGGWINSYIDNFGIYTRQLNSSEISELYNGGVRFDPYAPATGCSNFTISATNTYWGETLNIFNATVGAVDYTTTTGTITTNLCREDGNITNITVRSENHDDRTYLSYNTSTNLGAVLNFSYYRLNVTAIDDLNATITTFTISANGTNGSTTTGQVILNLTKGATYQVEIDAPTFAIYRANITMSDWQINYTFTLLKTNSVQIYIRDEITNAIITDNVTVRWSSNSTTWENITSTGSLFVWNITADAYQLLFYSTNYSTRSYTITVGNRSTQTLTAYMIASEYTTIFTMKDIDTGNILDNVSITMYKQIDSTWTTVESKYSDISGKAQFAYDPIAHYKFYLSKPDYEDYVFYLNPILFGEYDVFLTRTSLLNYSVDFDGIGIIYSPTQFVNGENTTFNYLITSPDGLLTDYSIKLTYPGGSDFDEGNNAIGEQLTAWVNITGATVYHHVVLQYNYTTSTSGERSFTVNLPIIVNQTSGVWMQLKDKTYGLGIFERILIVTIIVIFTVGIATMIGQPIAGLFLGLFVFGFLAFIGFIELWAILPSMLVGVLFLIWKSGGY